MKTLIILFLFFSINAFSQWEYSINSSKRISKAIGQIEFNYKKQDSLSLILSNSRKLGLDLSLTGNIFAKNQKFCSVANNLNFGLSEVVQGTF